MTFRQERIWKEVASQLAKQAFDAIIEREMDEQWEREMEGWMNTLDQDDQAINDFCRD